MRWGFALPVFLWLPAADLRAQGCYGGTQFRFQLREDGGRFLRRAPSVSFAYSAPPGFRPWEDFRRFGGYEGYGYPDYRERGYPGYFPQGFDAYSAPRFAPEYGGFPSTPAGYSAFPPFGGYALPGEFSGGGFSPPFFQGRSPY